MLLCFSPLPSWNAEGDGNAGIGSPLKSTPSCVCRAADRLLLLLHKYFSGLSLFSPRKEEEKLILSLSFSLLRWLVL